MKLSMKIMGYLIVAVISLTLFGTRVVWGQVPDGDPSPADIEWVATNGSGEGIFYQFLDPTAEGHAYGCFTLSCDDQGNCPPIDGQAIQDVIDAHDKCVVPEETSGDVTTPERRHIVINKIDLELELTSPIVIQGLTKPLTLLDEGALKLKPSTENPPAYGVHLVDNSVQVIFAGFGVESFQHGLYVENSVVEISKNNINFNDIGISVVSGEGSITKNRLMANGTAIDIAEDYQGNFNVTENEYGDIYADVDVQDGPQDEWDTAAEENPKWEEEEGTDSASEENPVWEEETGMEYASEADPESSNAVVETEPLGLQDPKPVDDLFIDGLDGGDDIGVGLRPVGFEMVGGSCSLYTGGAPQGSIWALLLLLILFGVFVYRTTLSDISSREQK